MSLLSSLLRRTRSGKLGLLEVVAMGVGGMVSGGIYAVLGVAMRQAGNAVPVSYLIGGIITLLTAYSYLKLTLHYGEHGGAFTFVEHTTPLLCDFWADKGVIFKSCPRVPKLRI
jgi:amino acid transporter